MKSSTSSQRPDKDLQDPSDLIDLVRSAWRHTLVSDPADDDTGFFDAGGDSFLLFALIGHIAEASGVTLKTIDVVRADSVRGQSALLARVMTDQREEPVSGA